MVAVRVESDGSWWLKDVFEPSRNRRVWLVSHEIRPYGPPEHVVVVKSTSAEEGRGLSRLFDLKRPLLLQGPSEQWYTVLAELRIEGLMGGCHA